MNKDNHLMFEAYVSRFFKSTPYNSEDCEDQAGVVDWRLRNKQSTDHVEHGRSAAKWELHSGEKVENPHHPDSDEGREWQFGYNEEKGISKDEASEDFRDQNEPGLGERIEGVYGDDLEDEMAHAFREQYRDLYNEVKDGLSYEEFAKRCNEISKGVKSLRDQDNEVMEKVSSVTKKQQALAGAVCNKQIGKHKGNAAKTAKFKKCVKGVEKSEVKYGYNPKKNK
jgi:hypothetical protein